MNITANLTTGNLSGFTITTSPYFTTAPTILISGGGGATQTTTCTLNTGLINAITLPGANLAYTTAPTIYILGGAGTGALLLTPVMDYKINTIAPTTNLEGGYVCLLEELIWNLDARRKGEAADATPDLQSSISAVRARISGRRP